MQHNPQGSCQNLVRLWRVCANSRLQMLRAGAAAAPGPDNSVGAKRCFYGGHLYHEDGMLPSQVTDTPWIWHTGNNTDGPNGPNATGKWMLFYKRGPHLDDAWTRATALCARGELYGVRDMKVSTAMVNPLAKDEENGVLIMYSGNEQETLQIGRNIVDKMKYTSRRDYMYWKGDAKTLAGVYSSPGQSASDYRVPTYRQAASPPPADPGLPSQTTSMTWLRHPGNAGEYDQETGGKWLLFCPTFKQLDKAWAKAKSLCEGGQLPGVCRMVAKTAANTGTTAGDGTSSPVILMFTPLRAAAGLKQTEVLLNSGNNIVAKMQYTNLHDGPKSMTWKAVEPVGAGKRQASTGTASADQDSRRPTTLQVPTFQKTTLDHSDIIYIEPSPSATTATTGSPSAAERLDGQPCSPPPPGRSDVIYLEPSPSAAAASSPYAAGRINAQSSSPPAPNHSDVIYIEPSPTAAAATSPYAAECTVSQPVSPPALSMQLSNQPSQPHRRRRRKQ